MMHTVASLVVAIMLFINSEGQLYGSRKLESSPKSLLGSIPLEGPRTVATNHSLSAQVKNEIPPADKPNSIIDIFSTLKETVDTVKRDDGCYEDLKSCITKFVKYFKELVTYVKGDCKGCIKRKCLLRDLLKTLRFQLAMDDYVDEIDCEQCAIEEIIETIKKFSDYLQNVALNNTNSNSGDRCDWDCVLKQIRVSAEKKNPRKPGRKPENIPIVTGENTPQQTSGGANSEDGSPTQNPDMSLKYGKEQNCKKCLEQKECSYCSEKLGCECDIRCDLCLRKHDCNYCKREGCQCESTKAEDCDKCHKEHPCSYCKHRFGCQCPSTNDQPQVPPKNVSECSQCLQKHDCDFCRSELGCRCKKRKQSCTKCLEHRSCKHCKKHYNCDCDAECDSCIERHDCIYCKKEYGCKCKLNQKEQCDKCLRLKQCAYCNEHHGCDCEQDCEKCLEENECDYCRKNYGCMCQNDRRCDKCLRDKECDYCHKKYNCQCTSR